MPTPYPYDPLGTYPTNLITNEHHAVTAPTADDQANFIVPRAAPFYVIGLIVKTGPAPTDPVMVEGVDYILTHHFVEASQSLNKRVYGSITFLNRLYTGDVYLTYQTIGGVYTLDDYSIVENLTRSLYSIRVVTWSQIAGLPALFPPVPHPHHTADLTGMSDVVAVLQLIRTAIASGTTNLNTLAATLTQHLNGSASHTAAQVGLGNLPNYREATQADIDNAVPNALVTAEMIVYAIYKYNSTGIALNDATEILKGISRLATDAEAINFIAPLNNVVITPATLLAALEAYDISKQIPVWDFYFTGDKNRDPATYLGYGTWVRITGKFPVAYDPADPVFDTGVTGGNKTATLTKQNMPDAIDITLPIKTGTGGSPTNTPGFSVDGTDLGNVTTSVDTNTGATEPFSILPPYFTMCIWQRIA